MGIKQKSGCGNNIKRQTIIVIKINKKFAQHKLDHNIK